jgi:glycosyltransferase involved in cell wall biosynthesis
MLDKGIALSPSILFVATEDYYFALHWLPLAVQAKNAGFKVIVATRFVHHLDLVERSGLCALPFEMDRRGLNPFGVIRESFKLSEIFKRECPDIVHLISLRPVVIGGIAARFAGISNIVSSVTGMGYVFTGSAPRFLRLLIERALPWLLSRGVTVSQNEEDAGQLIDMGVSKAQLRVIPGASGIDTEHFSPVQAPDGLPIIMMPSRLLWDKGVMEFVEAARLLRNLHARFVLVGAPDAGNPSSVSKGEIDIWVNEGVIEWWGYREDMPSTLRQAAIVCLPSYREGLPVALLEAMACGKPCVTTDVHGCRDAVRHEDNGLLVPMKDHEALAVAIRRLLDSPKLRERMGWRGREKVIREFGQEQVVGKTLDIYCEFIT